MLGDMHEAQRPLSRSSLDSRGLWSLEAGIRTSC